MQPHAWLTLCQPKRCQLSASLTAHPCPDRCESDSTVQCEGIQLPVISRLRPQSGRNTKAGKYNTVAASDTIAAAWRRESTADPAQLCRVADRGQRGRENTPTAARPTGRTRRHSGNKFKQHQECDRRADPSRHHDHHTAKRVGVCCTIAIREREVTLRGFRQVRRRRGRRHRGQHRRGPPQRRRHPCRHPSCRPSRPSSHRRRGSPGRSHGRDRVCR